MSGRTRIAIATGDPAGIGPEISLKAALDPAVRAACDPILVSDPAVVARHAKACGIAVELCAVERVADADFSGGRLNVLDCKQPDASKLEFGATNPVAGRASIAFVTAAVQAALAGEVDAVVGAPQNETSVAQAGIKFDDGAWTASAVAFDIRRPFVTDSCTPDCTRVVDGQQRHRGLELDAGWHAGVWSLQAGGTLLHTARERSANPADDALKPTNVPERSARAAIGYQLPDVPELTLGATVSHESSRLILPDNTARIPSWTRLDLAARWVQRLARQTLTWRLGVDNATDKRAWRESPFQFGHVYLYPLAARTWRGSLTAAF